MGQVQRSGGDHGERAGGLARLAGRLRISTDPKRLIRAGRLVSVLVTALAIYVDPSEPRRLLDEAHLVLAAYGLFALWLALMPTRAHLSSWLHLWSHAVDVTALGLLVYLTGELNSPVFPLAFFILLATTLRWNLVGAVLGALAIEAMMVATGWQDLLDGNAEINRLIIRSVTFMVAAVMLGYFGASLERSSHRFAQLAKWSAAPDSLEEAPWLEDMLRQATALLDAHRLLLVWKTEDETGGCAATLGPDGLRIVPIPGVSFRAEHEAGQSDADLKQDTAEVETIARTSGWTDLFIDPFAAHSAGFSNSKNAGRLYVVEREHRYEDLTSLTQVVASRIGDELERFALLRESAQNARDQDRVRLVRDLHDSVLQDLTAATLQLKTARLRLPEREGAILEDVGHLLGEQQRRIRLFIESARSPQAAAPQLLSVALSRKINRLCDQWGCDIDLDVKPADLHTPPSLHADVIQLLSEATANAVRHGGATRLSIEMSSEDGKLHMRIEDNGVGIDIAEGPAPPSWSIQSRVADLGGSISINRSAPGLAMTIEVPLA